MLLGLSKGGIVTPEMLMTMNPHPIIFALANPTPEIMPDVARAARPDAIIATGRSDYANLAACHALARLAHEDVPDSVMSAYGVRQLKFGAEYLIPKPLDPRVLLWVAPAVANAAMQSGAARRSIDLNSYRDELIRRQGFGQQFRNTLFNMAKAGDKKRIVFAEGEESKIIRAAHRVEEEGIGTPILLGDAEVIRREIAELGFVWEPHIVTPGPETDPNYERYLDELYKLRRRKGVNLNRAHSMLRSISFYAPMMVRMGQADAYVSGLSREYPDVARPAFQVLGRRAGVRTVSGVYIIIVRNRVYFFTDTTINIDPNAEELAQIAISAADFADSLGHKPRVAMLSFSNFGSVEHPLAAKMRDAVDIVTRQRPDIPIDGEMQADTAVVEQIVNERYPFSRVKDANVLVFPGLASANIAYKLIARLTEAEAVGPVLLGAGAPVQVLQAGDDVDSIVALAAFAALDAQRRR